MPHDPSMRASLRVPCRRRSIRLPGRDYAKPGSYFVTICTRSREALFGEIEDGVLRSSPLGRIAAACWREIPRHFPRVALDEFVVMPDHIHGIATLGAYELPAPEPRLQTFGRPVPDSIPTIVGAFKAAVTRQSNAASGTPGRTIWQRGYHERALRDDGSVRRVRGYIRANPVRARGVEARHAVSQHSTVGWTDPTNPDYGRGRED